MWRGSQCLVLRLLSGLFHICVLGSGVACSATRARVVGRTISDQWRVLRRYASTWMAVDVLSSVPFDLIFAGLSPATSPFQVAQILKLLVLLRVGRIIRIFEHIEGTAATAIRILGFMGGFLLIGHWLGLLWHFIAITPLEGVSRVGLAADGGNPLFDLATVPTDLSGGDAEADRGDGRPAQQDERDAQRHLAVHGDDATSHAGNERDRSVWPQPLFASRLLAIGC